MNMSDNQINFHYTQYESGVSERNEARYEIMRTLISITREAFERWEKRANIFYSPKRKASDPSKQTDYNLQIWYILCYIYLHPNERTTIEGFSKKFESLYSEHTIRKCLKDLRNVGAVRFVEGHLQISDEARKVVEEQLIMEYLNKYFDVSQKALAIGMIDSQKTT
jgi:hypothetical protein